MKNILIRDAEFTLDKKRVKEICEGLINSNYGISWRCETRVDTLDEALLEVMHKAGCIGINVGIESRSEEVCERSGRKPLSETHTERIIRRCQQLGIATFCFFLILTVDESSFSSLMFVLLFCAGAAILVRLCDDG